MSAEGNSREEIKERIEPVLNNVAVEGLRSWLRSIDLPTAARTRATVTDFVAEQIAKEQLAEAALEKALIGFEEASEMRIYLFRMDEMTTQPAEEWMPSRLRAEGVPLTNMRKFAGDRTKPMSPIYAEIEGGTLRVKWAEEHRMSKLNQTGDGVDFKPVPKRVVLIADFLSGTAELRLSPAENGHSYTDFSGRATPEAYYNAYIEKARQLLGCALQPIEMRPVIRRLVEEIEPRVIRIHIDNHTDQKNYKFKTTGPKADVRDSDGWQLDYSQNGDTWAWDAQSFYWLPGVSSEILNREVYSHIDAEAGFIKVNADCSDKEVTYVVTQIRTRETK